MLTEWLVLDEDELSSDERADLRAALIIEALNGRPATDTMRIISEYVAPVIDADELTERKAAAKAIRVKRAKRKQAANLAVAKAMQAENGKQQHRPLVSPSNP